VQRTDAPTSPQDPRKTRSTREWRARLYPQDRLLDRYDGKLQGSATSSTTATRASTPTREPIGWPTGEPTISVRRRQQHPEGATASSSVIFKSSPAPRLKAQHPDVETYYN
jgi:hypothetical protein